MSSCTLNWYVDRGFELDLTTQDAEVTLRMVAVPIPVDGTEELRAAPVPLDRLEILFKAQVDVSKGPGQRREPGQLQEASVQLITEEGEDRIKLWAKVEDVENGELIPVEDALRVQVPAEAPERDGPRPRPPDEDDLDWEDEATLEQMVVNAPEGSGSADDDEAHDEPPSQPQEGGLRALLKALDALGDEVEEGGESSEPIPGLQPGAPSTGPSPEPAGQLFSAEQEALGLLQLFLDREGIELEEGATLSELVPGVVSILADPSRSAEDKAVNLSAWLLDQPAVADLFMDDDEIAQVLERW